MLKLPNMDFKIYDDEGRRKTSPQNITWFYHKSFEIIQSRLRNTIWAKYPKNKLVREVSERKKRMKDSLLHTYVVVKTSNLVISRRRYAEAGKHRPRANVESKVASNTFK